MISHEVRPGINDPQLILPDQYDGNLIIHDVHQLKSGKTTEPVIYPGDISLVLEPRQLEQENLVYEFGRIVRLVVFTHGTLALTAEAEKMMLIEVIEGKVYVSRSGLNPTRVSKTGR